MPEQHTADDSCQGLGVLLKAQHQLKHTCVKNQNNCIVPGAMWAESIVIYQIPSMPMSLSRMCFTQLITQPMSSGRGCTLPLTYLQIAIMDACGILAEPATLMACRRAVTGRRLASGSQKGVLGSGLAADKMSCCRSHISCGLRSRRVTASARNLATAKSLHETETAFPAEPGLTLYCSTLQQPNPQSRIAPCACQVQRQEIITGPAA